MTVIENTEWIEALLQISREPVGVKFLFTKENYEACPVEELKSRMTYCTIVRHATCGTGCKFHAGHMACISGAASLGLSPASDEMLSGVRRYSQGAYQDMCICRKMSKNMVYCQHHSYGAVVLPLKEFTSEPDIVIIVCNPFNAMRVVQGYAYAHGHIDNICLSGMQAICQECTSFPYERDQLNLSLMCSGTRLLAGWNKDEMGIGMPYHLFQQVVEGLKATVNPLERDKNKSEIQKRASDKGLDGQLNIIFGHNYDDNCYKGGPVGLPQK